MKEKVRTICVYFLVCCSDNYSPCIIITFWIEQLGREVDATKESKGIFDTQEAHTTPFSM